MNPDGTFEEVQNVGADVNSPKDDFAYLIDTKSRIGFFSSNREGGKGYDDIYKFLELRPIKCEQELNGIITDVTTGEILPGSVVTLYDNEHKIINSIKSDEKGYYSFVVDCNKTYSVRAEKEDYNPKEKTITTSKETGTTKLDLALDKKICKVTIGDDLGTCFGIKWIYFDLDKSNIKPEAALDLAKILDVMKKYPTMKIDIRSHTDSRASFKYNEALSERRAKSTIEWLIKNGVTPDRLTGKGYGETLLLNKCSDGVICTEGEHQQNRRSEFIITAL
jgi:outer membrane protein OmpA-like peptidoglycan-associated protein